MAEPVRSCVDDRIGGRTEPLRARRDMLCRDDSGPHEQDEVAAPIEQCSVDSAF